MPIQPNQNARRVARVPGNTLGPVQVITETGSFSAAVQDISILGISFIADLEYLVGSSFVIESGPNGRKLQSLTAELRHSTQRADGRWLLGCCFSRPLMADDVERLG